MWKNSVYSDGSSIFVSNPIPVMGEEIEIAIRLKHEIIVDGIYLRLKKDGLEYIENMDLAYEEDGLDYYSCKVKVLSSVTQYHFYIVKENKIYYYTQRGIGDVLPDETYDFKILTGYENPKGIQGKVFYQIFPDRFCNGNDQISVKEKEYQFEGHDTIGIKDWKAEPKEYPEVFCLDFYGGDLPGIQNKIPYLQELGIDGIYVTPIFSAATVHRYDCIDYNHVDAHLGGDLALETLSKALHENDMKIIVDISINHTGTGHRWFNRYGDFYEKEFGAYHNQDAEEREFYYFAEDGSYGCYAGVPTLPKLNYGSEKLRELLFEGENAVLRKWLRKPYSIDGWRFDVAGTTGQFEYDHYNHDIWKKIRKAIKEEQKDAYILAEDWNDGYEYLQGEEWDAIMNFFGCGRPVREYVGQLDFRHGRKAALRHVAANSTGNALKDRVENFYCKLPFVVQQNQFNMLDCHDISRLHNDSSISFEQYKMAVYLLYTLPGCVCIYYGDEVGIKGRLGSSEGCRYPMEWEHDLKENRFYQLYQKMNRLKHNSRALREGGFKILYTEGKIFTCARFTKSEVVLLITSMEEKLQKEIPIDLSIFGVKFKMPKVDVMGEKIDIKKELDGQVYLDVKPQSGLMIFCCI